MVSAANKPADANLFREKKNCNLAYKPFKRTWRAIGLAEMVDQQIGEHVL
jgi:hypothetical protein